MLCVVDVSVDADVVLERRSKTEICPRVSIRHSGSRDATFSPQMKLNARAFQIFHFLNPNANILTMEVMLALNR